MRAPSPTEIELQIPGLTLAARVHGPPGGRPVLALHGWLDSAASFERLAPLLPGDLRLVCLDLPGHGRSQHRHRSATYDFVYWIPDVLAAADALGWDRFALLGHSMGAAVAICCAGTAPERVQRAVLIDGLGPLVAEAHEAPARLAAAIGDRRQRLTQRPYVHRDEAMAAAWLCKAIAGLTEPAARVLASRGLRPEGEGVTWRHDLRLRGRSLLRLTEDQVLAFLGRASCPTLVVRPEGGWPYDPAVIGARLERLADARTLTVPGCHHVHLVSPEVVAGPVGAFLAGESWPCSS